MKRFLIQWQHASYTGTRAVYASSYKTAENKLRKQLNKELPNVPEWMTHFAQVKEAK